jgi:hypothetical protein
MKHYKDSNGIVYAYESDGSQDDLIGNKALMTDAEVQAHFNPQPPIPSKQQLLTSITVTTQAGNTFDGNETARNNMLSALYAAEVTGLQSTNWKLADNSVAEVSLQELQEALTLSIQEVGRIVGAIE